jgi:predicted DsbA family dithiol-disulfide isomerase
MDLEIWTDVVCPWCGLGEHRLQAALARFPHREHVRVQHRAFQLDPSCPVGATKAVREVLRQKYRVDDAQMDAMCGRIEQLAAAEGLAPYHVGKNAIGNTGLAHALAKWATDQGKGDAIWERLYQAYFGELRSVFTVAALAELAGEVGLDAAAAREALESGRYRAEVDADQRTARAMGCTGVPFFVFDRSFAVSGAQPEETLLAALMRAWAARPEPLPVLAGDTAEAAACGPESCELP